MDLKFKNKIVNAVIAIQFIVVYAVLSDAVIDTGTEWYRQLKKPAIMPSPDSFVFVWFVLYVLLAAALYMLISKDGLKGLALYGSGYTILLSLFYAYSFFDRQNILSGLILIVLTFASSVVTTVLVYRRVKRAGILLVPFVLWLAYSVVINFLIFILN